MDEAIEKLNLDNGENTMGHEYAIGILGGMGTYATINIFKQYAQVFQAEKEWERPRIVIDNRCTMPSRVRAFLYNENVDQLIVEMVDSIKNLLNSGCTRILIGCNTAHIFLPKVLEQIPEAKECIFSIVDHCVKCLYKKKEKDVFILGSEGTIDSKIYQDALRENGVTFKVPTKEDYILIRECIEAVKTNHFSEQIKRIVIGLVDRHASCILGCTELPVLYEMYRRDIKSDRVYDPVHMALEQIKKEYDSE